jgi:hypothetical protein
LLNPSINVENIGNYLEFLNVPERIRSVDEIIKEIPFESKQHIVSDLNKLVNNGYLQMNMSHQSDPIYIITKHRKLYMMIMVALYILRRIDHNDSVIFDKYIVDKLHIPPKSRNVSIDNKIITQIMKTIQKNYPKFINNMRANIRSINLNTGSLYDKHKIEDAKLHQKNACSKAEIAKHNRQIAQENLKKFKMVYPYVPNISGYQSGGETDYKYKYYKYKAKYLQMKQITTADKPYKSLY